MRRIEGFAHKLSKGSKFSKLLASALMIVSTLCAEARFMIPGSSPDGAAIEGRNAPDVAKNRRKLFGRNTKAGSQPENALGDNALANPFSSESALTQQKFKFKQPKGNPAEELPVYPLNVAALPEKLDEIEVDEDDRFLYRATEFTHPEPDDDFVAYVRAKVPDVDKAMEAYNKFCLSE
ncbi:MAG: hypothetical protein GC165_07555 [Armatimonadetes bacterium]|nr:hypothetical protein [Armatimonadota bacterium]